MNISEIFTTFTNKIANILLFQREIESVFDKEFARLCEYSDKKIEGNDFNEYSALHFFYYPSPRDLIQKKYYSKEINVETRKNEINICKNKQYQWVIASVYEAYEDFLQESYAYLGYLDKNCWLLSNFGNVTLNNPLICNYEYLLQQSRNIKGLPQSILNQFRLIFPEFEKAEINNKLKINLKFRVIFIEKLRHHIVHTNGIVNDKSLFTEDVINKTGQYNKGKNRIEMTSFINDFFDNKDLNTTIMLIERIIQDNIPIISKDSRITELSNNLLSDAYLITQEIETKEKNA